MNEKLKAYAVQGSAVFLSTVPRIVGSGLLNALGGGFFGALLGVGIALGTSMWWGHARAETPAWALALLWLSPPALGAAGLYIGAVRGLLAGLAQQMLDKKLVAFLYAQLKPALVGATRKLQGKADVSAEEVARTLREELMPKLNQAAEKPSGFGDKVAGFLVLRSRRLMALSLIGHVARAKSGAEALAEAETLGVKKLEAVLVETIEDLFSIKLLLVGALALVVSAIPHLALALTEAG